MSRIIAGAAGGLRLASVPGTGTRPTTDRAKESLFAKLESYGVLARARVLDIYAGSGALGCEALSRGAAAVLLVDSAAPAVRACRHNARNVLKAVGETGRIQVIQAKARTYLAGSTETWDLVFYDPPYSLPNERVSTDMAALIPRLAAGAIVVVERSVRDSEPHWPPGMRRFASKKHGETVLYYAEPDTLPEKEN